MTTKHKAEVSADYVDAREINNPHLKEAATMLRQQQTLIDGADVVIKELQERLGQKVVEIEALKYEKSSGVYSDEPVAWMELYYGEPNNIAWTDAELRNSGEIYKTIPLYPHPAKEQYKFGVDWSKDGNAVTVLKIYEDGVAEVVFMDYQENPSQNRELTDEEIIGIRMTTEGDIKAFARAILRKAQEK